MRAPEARHLVSHVFPECNAHRFQYKRAAENHREICRFAWQQGYGGFGVSKSNIAAMVRYIQNQERHHKKMTFEEEFIALLEKHGIEYDRRYIFG
jgi:hypothetical protein